MMRLVYSTVVLFLSVTAVVTAVLPRPYTHHAVLDNLQTGNSSCVSTAFGAAVISFNRTTGILQYTLVNNVSMTTAAHIHGPAIVNGSASPLVSIGGFGPVPNSNPVATGSVTLAGVNFNDLDNGLCYFNISTVNCPGGEIRGQILALGQTITELDGLQDGVTTPAKGIAFTSYNPTTKNLTYTLVHNVANATACHIHGPATPGNTAPPLFFIATSQQQPHPYTGYFILNPANESYYQNGLFYFNVTSLANPNGEIRGQFYPAPNYLADLDGSQNNITSPYRGVGLATNYNANNLWAWIFHTIYQPNVTAAHIHTAPFGQTGNPTFTFANPQAMPISQDFTNITTDQMNFLANNSNYFNVSTLLNPGGEIRGQIYPKQSDQPAPPTTTSTTGTTTGTTANATTGSLTSSTGTHSTSTSSSSIVVCSLVLVFCAIAILMF